ncbi:MAG TPA: VWA domain-containing protein [Blastocatellia bacterium]|jgi:VWFA-related protein|nr:VWA domain-containing protein [Blastocatellia bacterium]
MLGMRVTTSLVVGCLWVLASALGGSQQDPAKRDDPPLKLETTLVQVPVIVSGSGGRYITDLKKGDFTIFEDGVKQEIEFFGSAEEPFNVALLLDSSGSTLTQLEYIKTSALAFIDNLRDHDRVMVVSFDDSVHVHCDLTSDRERLRRAVEQIKPGEYTQVYEALYTAVWERLQDVEGRKAVILFTDGIDNASSEISIDDTLDAIVESEDVLVYPIRYNTRADVEARMEKRLQGQKIEEARRQLDRDYRKADEYLQELADLSGGTVQRADQLGDLRAAFARVAEELRHQYVLGYYPANTKKNDAERKIAVRVSRDGAKIRTRPGYRTAQK